MTCQIVQIEEKEVRLTNLEKEMWPDGYTKADLIKYYVDMSPYILPYIKNRLFIMSRYPDGITGKMFYQKDAPEYTPEWVRTYPLVSERENKVVNYIVCDDLPTLVWLANQACIELHIWMAQKERLDYPDIVVFDLDPFPPATFKDTLDVAMLVKEALDRLGLQGYPKTSGSTGLHIFLPVRPEFTYAQVREGVRFLFEHIHAVYPEKTTLERSIDKRAGKVYLDYGQNTRGHTMTFHYSLRPHPGAPVSTPLTWDEVRAGDIEPEDFNIKTIFPRIAKVGDLYRPLLHQEQSFAGLLTLVT
ncbi:non-homologous end-joining DNA ligase [Thermincola ferriacetica]